MGGRGSSGGSGGGGKTIKLTGTEKQIAWAKQIIADSHATIDKNIARNKENSKLLGGGPPRGAFAKNIERAELVRKKYNEALAVIEKKPNSAAFIIDNRRSLDSGYILRLL